MTTENIKSRLIFYNPWWNEKSVSPSLALPFKRDIFLKLRDYLNLDRIIILKGPRRTGKSILLHQTMQSLINNGTLPNDILYLNFEDPLLRTDFHDLVSAYESLTGRETNKGKTSFFFLDEIHLLPDWAECLKAFFDKKYPIKFICSGSSSSLLQKTGESLMGRTIEETVLPFSFREWAKYHLDKEGFRDEITKDNYTLHKKKVSLLWESYLKRGGFAHILNQDNPELLKKLIHEDVVQKVIYKDLVDLYGIREPAVLEKVFYYLVKGSGQILNITSLSQTLGISRQTLSQYLSFLKRAYLYFELPKFSLSIKQTLGSAVKTHLIDPVFFLLLPEANTDLVLETTVAGQVFYKQQRDVFHFREREEIDLVIQTESGAYPVEVKNSSNLNTKSLNVMLKFMDKYSVKEGTVVYCGEEKELKIADKKIKLTPAPKFAFFL
jgi:predicted AAA+ superfamily ATPase